MPTERLRAEIDELFASDRELASILVDVARLSVRSMLQTALEAESRSSWAEPAISGAPTGPARFPQRLAAAGGGEDHDGPD